MTCRWGILGAMHTASAPARSIASNVNTASWISEPSMTPQPDNTTPIFFAIATSSSYPSALVMATQTKNMERLLQIMARLRGPGGCSWDREQTHQSIRHNLIEECYEVLEALDNFVD